MAGTPEIGAKKVFVSYKREERDLALFVREKLSTLGVEFFMDVELTPDGDYGRRLDTYLAEAFAVLVLWTNLSKSSNFVCSEAQKGFNRHILVAARFDNVSVDELSVPFNRFHTSDLSNWRQSGASAQDAEWQNVLEALGNKLGRPGLVQLALALESDTIDAKHAFLRQFPDDVAAARIADDLEAIEREAFAEQMLVASRRLGRRQSDTQRKLKDCREEFDAQLVQLRLGKGFVRPDPMRVFDAKAEALRDKVEEYEQSNQNYRLRVEKIEEAVSASVERIAARDKELRDLRARFQSETDALAEKCQIAARDIEQKDRELKELNRRYVGLQTTAEVLPELDARLGSLQRETQVKDAQIVRLKADYEALLKKKPPITTRQFGIGAATAAVVGLLLGSAVMLRAPVVARTDESLMQVQLEQEKTRALAQQIQGKEAEITALSGRLDQAQQNVAGLQRQLAAVPAMQGNAKQFDEQLKREQDRARLVAQQLQVKEADVANLTIRLAEQQKDAASLRTQLASMQDTDKNRLQELNGLRTQVTQAQASAKQSDDQLKREQDRTRALASQIQSKETELARASTQLEQRQKEANDLRTQLASAQGQQGSATQPKQPPQRIAIAPARKPVPQFTTYANYDMVGGDYLTQKEVTRDWCESECKSSDKCVAYTYDKWKNHCSLKDSVGVVKLEPKGDTAVRFDQGIPRKVDEQERFCSYTRKAFQGSASQTHSRVASREACRSLCRADQSCIGFTFVASADNMCRLFSATTGPVSDPTGYSEIKAQKPRSPWCSG